MIGFAEVVAEFRMCSCSDRIDPHFVWREFRMSKFARKRMFELKFNAHDQNGD